MGRPFLKKFRRMTSKHLEKIFEKTIDFLGLPWYNLVTRSGCEWRTSA
jgi:hypothetical protein